ncbi:YybH family protein [Arenimonas daejeonensis]|uniref:YybH family protein n=1 Tax=Arenimonas daejeonensis TaxID=370777 RepID=UPI001D153D3A|nr:nuclear transport factor 2 family protein [Arenimonas daejeonensis]
MTRPSTLLLCLALSSCASMPAPPAADLAELTRQVEAAETAFAQTMADRDFEAFASHIADDAIFVNGRNPLRGKKVILADWEKYFDGPAPFSWKPETVVVLDDGSLAQTKGPVSDPSGKPILEFRSTWRREPDGHWKVIFDDGACRCTGRKAAD